MAVLGIMTAYTMDIDLHGSPRYGPDAVHAWTKKNEEERGLISGGGQMEMGGVGE